MSSKKADNKKAENKKQILLCGGGGCIASGALDVKAALEEGLQNRGLEAEVSLGMTGCMGPCAQGPVVKVLPGGILYQGVKPEDAPEILDKEFLGGGERVERPLWQGENTGELGPRAAGIP